ncbi:histidine kinase, partial [Streptomyces sp. 8P21H-1]|nr:histidine kinase [Streptomyces sp. 8P21H-1]
ALATASRRAGPARVAVLVDATVTLPDGRPGVRLTVSDGGDTDGDADGTGGGEATPATWQSPL